MNKKNKEKNRLQELFEESPEFKQFFFFGFYIIFFIFLVVILRSAYKSNNEHVTRYNSGYKHNFTLEEIKKDNYYFTYTLYKNNQVIVYEGKKNKEFSEFIMSGEVASEYKRQGNNYSKKNINTLLYENVTSPMEFDKLLDNDILSRIFVRASYISRTEYLEKEEKDYNYEIATSTLTKVVDNMETDLDSINKIVAHVSDSGELYQIDMDVTNYFKYFDNTIYNYTLKLNYSKFGEVE